MLFKIFVFCFSFIILCHANKQQRLALSTLDKQKIGRQIWQNESGKSYRGLVSWNRGEAFPSLGIGHFIWYPANYQGRWQESFPQFISHCLSSKKYSHMVPNWITIIMPAPWANRKQFLAREFGKKATQLRRFLRATLAVQVDFIYLRTQQVATKIVQTRQLTERQKRYLLQLWQKLVQSTQGAYLLMDYVNFKGEGLSQKERYRGKGWGLVQVLLAMPQDSLTCQRRQLYQYFAQAADDILTRRCRLAPKKRKEYRWLKGWRKRLQTYINPL